MKIVHFAQTTSTNDEALNHDYPHNTILVADHQTAGRGQRGNLWQTKSGDNLTFSVVIRPVELLAAEQYRLSMIAALASSDTLCEAGVECLIKWSNDLYVGDCKIGGMLFENSLKGGLVNVSIIGIGINVLQENFPIELPNPTSLIKEGVTGHTPAELLELFIPHFQSRYCESTQTLHRDYMDRLWRREGYHQFADESGEFRAAIQKVDPLTGRLTLQMEDGEQRGYWFQEVKFLL